MNKPYLNAALAQINERITVERLAEKVPAIGNLKKSNELLTQIMNRVAVVVQKHQLTIMTDDESGLTIDGFKPGDAVKEVREGLSLLRMTAVKHQ